MIDLVCLLPDKNIEAAVDGLLKRPQALGIRAPTFEVVVHPGRDPACFHKAGDLLAGYVERARHGLVVLDRQWDGVPKGSAADLEEQLEARLAKVAPEGWARAVIIDPELEAWVFSDAPHVATELGWPGTTEEMRSTLQTEGLWASGRPKPQDPKAAMEWVLRRTRRPRSSSIYRALATKVGVKRCDDRSFLRLIELLRGWFISA